MLRPRRSAKKIFGVSIENGEREREKREREREKDWWSIWQGHVFSEDYVPFTPKAALTDE